MMRQFSLFVLSVITIFSPAMATEGRSDGAARLGTGPMPCRWRTLQSQGFEDPIGQGVELRFVGTVPAKVGHYYIYHWDFVNPETIHGRQSILILKYRCRYIGQYGIMAPPLRISGDTVFFDSPKKWGNKLRFANGLLPRQTWINGEVNNFRR